MLDLSKLQTAVAKLTTVEASTVTLLKTIAAEIKNLPNDQAAIDALAAQIDGNAEDMAKAVIENTPETPAPPSQG